MVFFFLFSNTQSAKCPDLKFQLKLKVLAVHCSAQILSSERCYRTRDLKAIGSASLIPHAVPHCYFLSDP